MLLSMTGQGQGQASNDRIAVSIELRAINSRFLKVSFNGVDSFGFMFSELEALIRERVRRGTVNVHVRIEDRQDSQQYRLNQAAIASYKQQLEQWFPGQAIDVSSLLLVPGVIDEADSGDLPQEDVSLVSTQALSAALDTLNEMREREGKAMGEELIENCRELAQISKAVEQRSPKVVEAYAERLEDRINQMLAKLDAEIDRKDIVREVGIFADRCDINEELVRLQSHVEQFEQVIGSPESSGRKLDFLTQELLRETNTIGSKSNDAEIAGQVVQMKTVIERIKEMVQNIE